MPRSLGSLRSPLLCFAMEGLLYVKLSILFTKKLRFWGSWRMDDVMSRFLSNGPGMMKEREEEEEVVIDKLYILLALWFLVICF